MKTKLLLLLLFCWVGIIQGQEKKNITSLEQNYSTTYQKKGFWKKTYCEGKCDTIKCVKKHRTFIEGQVNNGVKINNTNTYVIEYDFKEGIYKRNNLKLKVNTPVAFKINNINRLAYDVNIASKDSLLSGTFAFDSPYSHLPVIKKSENIDATTNPATNNKTKDINTINSGDIAEKEGEKKEEKSENKESVLKEIATISKQEVLTRELQELKNQLEHEKRTIQQLIIVNKEKIKEIENDTTITDSKKKDSLINLNKILNTFLELDNDILLSKDHKINDSLKINISIVKNIIAIQEKYSVKKEEYDRLDTVKIVSLKKFNDDQQKLIAVFTQLNDMYNKVQIISTSYQEVTDVTLNTELTQELYKDKFKDHFKNILLELPYFREYIKNITEKAVEFDILHSYIKYNPDLEQVLNYGGIVKLYAHSDYLKDVVENMKKIFKASECEDKISYMKQNIPLMDEEKTYYVISKPLQPIFDVAIFNVDIKKRANNKSTLKAEHSFSHKEYTYGGTRLDASIGMAGSVYPNANTYELIVKNDTIMQIKRKSKDTFVPSILGMVTMSYRSAGYLTVGGSAGMGLDVTDGKIQLSNFYAGPSAIFGKHDRLILTAGVSVRSVDKLKSEYTVDTDMQLNENVSNLDNFVTKTYRFGYFVSLTYNLTKGVKDNAKYIKTLL